ncbi:pentatricopeptide repeat-containing protein At5g09450, mitochondrial [Malania oleifera]|uniref:pentatricopeptide repeat-containing protein At5g09450, mitochondrial n=1 Tax=Malania oleifera TaxID=397392 RepID=UPI0025ADC86B|nr:pentatricopeptide repeat-containing protein At5g09450, mitochondrial [Malania oleifera]
MASRALFFGLTRKCSSRSINPRCRSGGILCRLLSSGAPRTEHLEESTNSTWSDGGENDDLKSRIFRLRLPKRSATNVLQRWVHEGNRITLSELRHISKELRKSQRHKHALEISEWMVTHEEFELSDSDFADRIELMSKVFGINAAERYFEGLPLTAKTCETYTALLHSFAGAKLTEKAEELYERIKESNLLFSALTYNEMMTLYMSVGQVEKVSSVVEELKRQKIAPDLFTYNLWISSCAATLNIEGVRRILDEMSCDSSSNEGWVRYINLANIYVTASQLVNSGPNSIVDSEKGITQREWITYDFLILLFAGLGNKDKINQIWASMKMTKQKMTGRNYASIISSYLMLGHMKEVEEVIDQWKLSTTVDFNTSICRSIMKSFSEIGLTENAEAFRLLLIEKNCNP